MTIDPSLFEENFRSFGELGASVSVWRAGEETTSLHAGFLDREKTQPWSDSTLVQVWSCTKGIASVAFVHALHTHGISLQTKVAHIWTEFAAHGKREITILQMLAHQAGLSAIDAPIPDSFDFEGVTAALARQAPLWEPGTAHGYHARTFGYLLDAVLLRVAGVDVGTWWRNHFAEPFHLDVWIGLPGEHHGRVAELQMASGKRFPNPEFDPFYKSMSQPGSLAQRTMNSPAGLSSVRAMNTAEAREASLPSLSGVATASGLAKFYGMLADADLRNLFFPEELFHALTTRVSDGWDLVLQMPTAFGAGVMLDPTDVQGRKLRSIFGPSLSAFGHPGAGGSLAFADPERKLGFAYVMNQMELGVLPNPKALRLVDSMAVESAA